MDGVWIILLPLSYLFIAGCLAAIGYAIWYWVERRERFEPARRGFEVKPTSGPAPEKK